MKPLVSFVIPAYNAAPYLAEAIESCLQQDYKNIEVVVVNDGSTDSTDTLMQWYVKNPDVTYVKQENTGIAGARNAGIKASTGEYIAVMDADDVCSPERIKKSLKKLEKAGVDAVYTDYYQGDESMNIFAGQEGPPDVTKENILANNSAPHVTITAKRECFIDNPYPENAKVNDDAWLLAKWLKAGYKFARVPEALMMVRYHANSTSATKDEEVRKVGKEVEGFLNGTA